jgi:type II secretory pathway component PulK
MPYVSLKYFKNRRMRNGSVLILVLIVLSSMTILSVGLAYRTLIEMKLAHNNAQRTQAYYLALGGIERIKALLSSQELSPAMIAQMCQFTNTAQNEGLFEQFKEFEPPEGSLLTYSLRDEQGYFNLNRSDPASWIPIECVSKECCSTILDWIDEDNDAGPGGAETDFYERLENPYAAKNAPFVTLKELLFLKGITRDIYLGEDLNRNSLLDDNERDGPYQIPFDNEDNVLDPGLLDIFTTYGEGNININTASGEILSALPGLDEQAAESLLAHRAGPDRQYGTEDDGFFTSAEDLVSVEGLTDLQIELLGQYCCFDSEYFRIFSSAGLNNTIKCCLMATIKCAESQPQILYLERLL